MKPTLEEDCFTEELLLDLTLDEELTDELDLSLLLLEESPDFTELELLESEEVLVSFAELLDTSAGSEPLKLLDDLSFSIFSSLDPFDSANAPLRVTLESGDSTDKLETPVSSELADDESSQAVRTNPRQSAVRMDPIAADSIGALPLQNDRLQDDSKKDFLIKTSFVNLTP